MMSRLVWNSFWLTPILLGTAIFSASAQVGHTSSLETQSSVLKQVAAYGAEGQGNELSQVTSVSQFSDVRPTDWAFQALQSLVERYGCIVGYPDKTYRGNRALSRYEFAAGLNACLDKIQELIAAATADFVRKEDLEVVKRLQEEFAAELASLRGRVEALEVRTATLEKQQFSTTTKLSGEVIFGIADTFGDAATRRGNDTVITGVDADDNTQTIFANRVRLNFDASFTGKDRLRTRLQAANVTPFSGDFTGTNMTRLSFDGNNGNSVEIDELYYRFPVGQNLRLQIDATNTEFYDGLVSSLSPFESSGTGAVSRFGRFNPVLRSGTSGAGFTFDYQLSRAFSLQGGYIADTLSNDPNRKNGLFDGAYSALGQLVIRPSRNIDVALTYVRSFYPAVTDPGVNITSSTGSEFARRPFGSGNATAVDTFGAQAQWRLSSAITLGGWFGWHQAYNRNSSDEASIINWAGFLAFPDLGRKGNLGGIIVGGTPRVTDTDYRPSANRRRLVDEDQSIHVEALYRYRINDNIAITPGVIVIFNPENQSSNDTQFVGVVRTTFTF